MKINDKRELNKAVGFDEMLAGNVYVDVHGIYVLATDEDILVSVCEGIVWRESDYEGYDDVFIPVTATLEIE